MTFFSIRAMINNRMKLGTITVSGGLTFIVQSSMLLICLQYKITAIACPASTLNLLLIQTTSDGLQDCGNWQTLGKTRLKLCWVGEEQFVNKVKAISKIGYPPYCFKCQKELIIA